MNSLPNLPLDPDNSPGVPPPSGRAPVPTSSAPSRRLLVPTPVPVAEHVPAPMDLPATERRAETPVPALLLDRDRASRSPVTGKPLRASRPAARRSTARPEPVVLPGGPSQRMQRRREAVGIVLLALGLFVLLSGGSLVFGDGKLMGPVGDGVAMALYQVLGAGLFVLGGGVLALAVQRLRGLLVTISPLRVVGVLTGLFALGILFHLVGHGVRVRGASPGGAIGEYVAELLVTLLGTPGAVLLALSLLTLALLATTSLSLATLTRALWTTLRQWALTSGHAVAQFFRTLWAEVQGRFFPKRPIIEMPVPVGVGAGGAESGVPQPLRDYGDDRDERASGRPLLDKPSGLGKVSGEAPPKRATTPAAPKRAATPAPASAPAPVIVERRPAISPDLVVVADASPSPKPPVSPDLVAAPASPPASAAPVVPRISVTVEPVLVLEAAPAAVPVAWQGDVTTPCAPPADMEGGEAPEDAASPADVLFVPPHEGIDPTDVSDASGPLPASGRPRPRSKKGLNYLPLRSGPYEPPPLDVFDYLEPAQRELDRKAMLDLAQRLEATLADYQVKGRVTAIHPGPVVTMYEFVPAPGIKLSKITALSSDLAMALEALRVRIVAPIPGKAAVGIEVPNRSRETVYLKEILADTAFSQAKSKLTMALGKDIAGVPLTVDLAKMPHLLVAGTTGSGKSVSVNGMVCSLLCNASPDDVKMIMIDPKMLELSIYEGIPHLLLPVVTDPKKANLALKWAVDEMERRYELISKEGVRDIGGYNKKIERLLETVEQGQRDLFSDSEYVMAEAPKRLPYIVVLIDEFADLMMVASKEVEISVARIAQKARAAGIHLILATQRPSVDVITGLIKANFPSRIAFQVASRVDSRTILDQQGAENLLGMGDMLFTDRGQALRRIHGALITDTEVHKVVEHLKKQGQPIYDMDILKPRLDEDEEVFEEDMSDDLYDEAVRLVTESRQASISMVQRRLRIGYNRAARMIERMERDGLVSAPDGKNGREVLASAL